MKADSTPDVFTFLRFPLALSVVFIHSVGTRLPDLAPAAGSAQWGYDLVRLTLSTIAPSFAVPLFFLISGYFFFLNMTEWDTRQYLGKLRRRVSTLLIPYLLWNLLYALHLTWSTLAPALFADGPWTAWLAQMQHWGGWRMFLDSHVIGPHSTAPVLAPLWFLRDLMVAVLLAPAISWLARHTRWYASAVLGLLYVFTHRNPLIGCFFWFTVGSTCSILKVQVVALCRRLRMPALLLAMAILSVMLGAWSGGMSLKLLHRSVLQTAYIFAAVVGVTALADLALRHGWTRPHPRLSAASMFIYVSHIFFLAPVMRLMKGLLPNGCYPVMTLRYILVPLLVVTLCAGLHLLYQHARERLSRPSITN